MPALGAGQCRLRRRAKSSPAVRPPATIRRRSQLLAERQHTLDCRKTGAISDEESSAEGLLCKAAGELARALLCVCPIVCLLVLIGEHRRHRRRMSERDKHRHSPARVVKPIRSRSANSLSATPQWCATVFGPVDAMAGRSRHSRIDQPERTTHEDPTRRPRRRWHARRRM